MDHAATRDAIALWERHFRDPEASAAQAEARLAGTPIETADARAWYALTLAFHHLFFTARPPDARRFLADAKRGFQQNGDRRGELLAAIGAARLAIVEREPDAARQQLMALYAEALQALPPEDRFWLLNAIGAAHYFTDRLDVKLGLVALVLAIVLAIVTRRRLIAERTARVLAGERIPLMTTAERRATHWPMRDKAKL